MSIQVNTIVRGDCIEELTKIAENQGPVADLVFADPPFNIGYKYDVYEDRKAYRKYRTWTTDWMRACRNILRHNGSFWIAMGAEYAAEVRMIGLRLGLTLRNWIIWHYTFGQNTRRKFGRSHTHLFYFVVDPKDFVFNDDAVRTFSDREREYSDKRAGEKGRIPDDVWTEFPRVCGTFGERENWHPCQMPESLLARIIRCCTGRGQLVLDPFAGSGTTLVAAKKLSREYLGFELSENYVEGVKARLANTSPMSKIRGEHPDGWPGDHLDLLKSAYLEFSVPTDKLFNVETLLRRFTERFNRRLNYSGMDDEYTHSDIRGQLMRLRKKGALPRIRVHANETRKF
jgi:site-specific DNA-methyltransferase (adenine-specific)